MNSNIEIVGNITVYGGDGGNGYGVNTGAFAGNGGDAAFNAGSGNVTAGGVNIASGARGSYDNAGSGGSVYFAVSGVLSAPSITLTKNDGSLTFTAGTLLVDQNTALTLDKGTASGTLDVSVNGLAFEGGSTLTINRIQGSETMTNLGGNLSVSGAGNSLNSPIAFDASGKTLSFDLTGLTAGAPAFSVSGTGGITVDSATTLSLSGASGVGLGQRATLINGGLSSSLDASQLGTLTVSEGGGLSKDYLLSMPGGDSLSGFVSRIAATGDYAVTGPYSISAGSGTNESVLLDVTGKLTLSGGLSLAENGANSATVNAGTLVAPSLALTGANARANIDTLDMSANSTALTGTGSTTANFNVTTANLSGGNLFSIDNSAGALNVGTLNVSNSGRLYVTSGGNQAITNLNAANADLTFILPASVVAGQTIVAVGTANMDGATIGVNDGNGRVNMVAGESVTLIAAATSLTATGVNLTVQTTNGDIFDVRVNGNDLLLILQQLSPTTPAYERLKAFAEGRAAGLVFVNQGADLALGQGMGSALAATSEPGFQISAFGAGQGGWSRYNIGSHVDVSGFSMLAGLAVGNDLGMGRLTLGAFFEGGWGSYDSHNSFSNYASVKGNGDTNYYGGGLLGRYDIKQGAFSGLYFDASARMGRASADFGSGDIEYNGSKADFDSSALYYGMHAGLGYQWTFTEKAVLDLSGKFIWTHQDSDNVDVHGDKERFKDADSLRTRLGGRFNYAVCDYATPYVGAYWEHEFDGKQRSSVNGNGIGSPSLKGDTGVGELGVTIKPVKDSGFSFDLGVQGHTGVREGVSGSLQLKFEF